MIKNLIYQKGNSDKFWRIVTADKTFTTTYGPNYGQTNSNVKNFDTTELCEKEAGKLVVSKLKEGYEEVPLPISDARVVTLKKVWDAQQHNLEELTINVEGSVALTELVCTLTSLKKLQLEGASVIPDSIANLTQLENLSIDKCTPSHLPDSLGQLTNLTWLTISDTSIRVLPQTIGQLTRLSKLSLYRNQQLETLPDTIGLLKNLRKLIVFSNNEAGRRITGLSIQIPESLGGLTDLEELRLSHNSLTTLPNSIGQLKKLKVLDLGYNKLAEIPLTVYDLTALETLRLEQNPFTKLDPRICQLEKLSGLELRNTAIENVPAEILQEGIHAIRNYLSGAAPESQRMALPIPALDKKEIVAKRSDALDKFYRSAKNKIYTEFFEKKFETLKKYITGQTDEVPKATTDDNYYFEEIIDVLMPFRQWNAIDHRILAYISQQAWSLDKNENGFNRGFFRSLSQQIKNDPSDIFLFQNVITLLKENGIEETRILTQCLKNMDDVALTPDSKPTCFGNYLLEVFDTHTLHMVQQGLREDKLELLLRYKNEMLQPYITEITKIENYKGEDGSQHVNANVLAILCKIHPEQYEALIIDRIKQIDCQSCKAEAASILLDYCGSRHQEMVYAFIKETLQYVSEKKNKNIKNGYSFRWDRTGGYHSKCTMPQFLTWIFKHYGPAAKQDVFEYVENTKVLDLEVIAVAVKHLRQEAVDIAGEALYMKIENESLAAYFRQAFVILSELDYSKYYDKAWEIATCEFEKVGETACLALSRVDENIVLPRAKQLLTDKKKHIRKAGALILQLLASSPSLEALKPVLEEENEDIRNVAVQAWFRDPKNISIDDAKERITAAYKRGKLKKPIAKWLDESQLPPIHWVSGEVIDQDTIRFLLYRQKSADQISIDQEARDIYPLFDKKTIGAFAKGLLDLVLKNGGLKAPNRFAIALVGLLGDESIVGDLSKIAIEQMNVNACACLGNMNSLAAARALDKIMQVFRTKYPNVREAAAEAFEAIAANMNLDVYALSDKIIPDFGFTGLEKLIIQDKNTYKVVIGKNLDLLYFDESGKSLKAIPKSNAETKQIIKAIAAELRDAVKQFRYHLEYYLVTQRKYTGIEWKSFFLEQPLAHAFAQNFIWAIYEENQLTGTFLLQDGVIKNEHDHTISLDDNAFLSLLHPLQIDKALNHLWQQKLNVLNIAPPFQQLSRQVFSVTESNKSKTMSYDFYDREVAAISFKSRAEKSGWRRGSVVDSGGISSYRKVFATQDTEVFIKTDNLGIDNYDLESPMTCKELYFVKRGAVVTGSYVYDDPRDENDHRLIPFSAVDPIVYSEAIYEVKKILGTPDEADE